MLKEPKPSSSTLIHSFEAKQTIPNQYCLYSYVVPTDIYELVSTNTQPIADVHKVVLLDTDSESKDTGARIVQCVMKIE